MTNTRPRSSRGKPSRRDRRSTTTSSASTAPHPRSGVQVYDTPAASTTSSGAKIAPRRSYLAEPGPVDYSNEYRFIRHDLVRIFLWASVLIAVMFVLWLLPVL